MRMRRQPPRAASLRVTRPSGSSSATHTQRSRSFTGFSRGKYRRSGSDDIVRDVEPAVTGETDREVREEEPPRLPKSPCVSGLPLAERADTKVRSNVTALEEDMQPKAL